LKNYWRHFFYEKNLHRVTANSRQDGIELLHLAAEMPLKPKSITFPLQGANIALQQLKHDAISGISGTDRAVNMELRMKAEADQRRNIELFYHLTPADLAVCACGGMACFVSRHHNPRRWRQASSQSARVPSKRRPP
jgi:hypothetical protein